jgi:chromate transport protein ChrA
MARPVARAVAVLCYLGAIRVPVVALVVPEWALTIPSGLLVAGLAWAYGAKRSPFLLHHAREGLKWSVQANLLLAAISLLSMGLHALWSQTGGAVIHSLWHLAADLFWWAGILVSILTLFVMYKAAQGETGDALVGRSDSHTTR